MPGDDHRQVDDPMVDLINEVRDGAVTGPTMAGGHRVDFTLLHHGQTIMPKSYDAR